VPTCVLVLVVFLFCISYVTHLQDDVKVVSKLMYILFFAFIFGYDNYWNWSKCGKITTSNRDYKFLL